MAGRAEPFGGNVLRVVRTRGRNQRLLAGAAAVWLAWSCGETTTVDPPVATTVAVTPETVRMDAIEATEQLAAEVRDQHGLLMTAPVTWASSDETVARVNASGLVTAAGNGTATATATAGSATGTAAVTVEQVLAALLPSPASVELTALGDTATLTVQAADANGHPMNVSLANVTWTSQDEDVATVSASGVVTAVANGSASVSASSGSVNGSATVTVRQEAATLTAAFDTASVAASGGLARFTGVDSLLIVAFDVGVDLVAAASDANGHALDDPAIAWSSSQPSVAEIDSAGRVTSLARGTATLTASLGSQTASVWLSVEQEPAALAVSPDTVAFTELGATQRLGVEVVDANGHAIDQHSVRATWSSSQEDVATVNASGVVTAVYNGTATITATWQELSGTATVRVEVNLGREILTAFYEATDGDDWSNNAHWLSDRPLGEWWGVTTDSAGWVTHLVLDENEVRSSLPGELGGLTRLVQLSLDDNQLVGPLPSELRNLARLEGLDLAYNRLTGPLPAWLPELDGLKSLSLYDNRLSGEIPRGLGELVNLTRLVLGENYLTGAIPAELGNLARLEHLNLHMNWLTGSIPPELGQLTELSSLSLYSNRLTGTIPPELGNLTKVSWFALSNNGLTGSIPPELGSAATMTHLLLGNNQLSGSVPSELGNLDRLWSLRLESNRLEGPLPVGLLRLTSLGRLYFHNNDSLCAPRTAAFEAWIAAIGSVAGNFCN